MYMCVHLIHLHVLYLHSNLTDKHTQRHMCHTYHGKPNICSSQCWTIVGSVPCYRDNLSGLGEPRLDNSVDEDKLVLRG